MFQWRVNARMRLYACARWCESAHFVHVRRHFSLDAPNLIFEQQSPPYNSQFYAFPKVADLEKLHSIHYENTPIQYIENFTSKNWEFFQIKTMIFFIFLLKTYCGYSLEPHRRGGSNEYPQSMFWTKIRQIMFTPVNPNFDYIKVGFKGVKII